MGGEGFEFIGRRDERQAGDLRHIGRHHFRPARLGIQTRTDRCAALGEFIDPPQCIFNALDTHGHLMAVAGKFLAEGEGGGVLGMGAADFDDSIEFDNFCL